VYSVSSPVLPARTSGLPIDQPNDPGLRKGIYGASQLLIG
jgi:hypothetical protein